MDQQNSESIKSFVKNNMRFYETALLLIILDNFNFWETKCKNIINVSNGGLRFNDFTQSIDNDIYREICSIYSAIPENIRNSGTTIKASKEIILAMIANKCSDPKSKLNPNDLIVAELRFKDVEALRMDPLMQSENASLISIVESGMAYWLEMRRVVQIANYSIRNLDKIDATSVISKIQGSIDQIGANIKEDSDAIQSFGQALDSVTKSEEDDSMSRIPLPGLPILTKALGGGLKHGETGLIIAGSGGGKTVIALQIASGVALLGYKSLFITTEQHAKALSSRIAACNANILFDKIKDGVALNKLNEAEINRMLQIRGPLDANLEFANWCKTGEMLETHLEQLIKDKKSRDGLDVLVIDWLGGGLGVTAEQADKMQNYMMHCVNRIKILALQYNIFILVLAQTNEKDEKRKMKLGRIDIDRCHTLDQPFTWALGISSLQAPSNQRVNSPQESYLRKQYVNIWKGRMAGDLFYPIIREFEYQRFVEKEITELNNMPARTVNFGNG